MKTFVLAAVLALSPLAANAGPIAQIQKITVADLQDALADANAQTPPDTRNGQCWTALIPFVQNFQTLSVLPAKPGLALLIQKTADLKAKAGKPLIPDNVVQACALTLADINMTLVQLTNALGVSALALPKLPF